MEPLHLKVGNGFQVTRYISFLKTSYKLLFQEHYSSIVFHFDPLLPRHKSPIVILQLQVKVTILLVLQSNGVTVPLRN